MKKSGNDYDGLFDGLNRGKDSFKMTITPEIAAKMLEWNNHNRPLYSATYINYARQMSNNKWRETGVPLIFDPRGLADGQHRLKAILLSGKTYTFTINITEDEEIHMYLDNGFPVELPVCPVCGFVYVPEELALGKVLSVEKALEDK